MEYGITAYTKIIGHAALAALIPLALAATDASAEPTTTIIGGGGDKGGSQAIVNEKAGGSMVNPNAIADNSAANGKNGREFKANDAQKQGNAGKVAAIVAGSGMVAAAIPLLASIDPVQVAAGATLMGMAGMEFAQAAASGGAANKNGDQKNTLTADDGQKGSSPSGGDARSEAANALKSDPALNDLLASRGVNPDEFANALTSGQLTDPQAVLSAVGNKVPVPPDAMAQGQAAAINFAGAGLEGKPEKNGLPEIVRVTNNDDVAKGGSEAAKTAAGSGGIGKPDGGAGAPAPGATAGNASGGVGKPGAVGAAGKAKEGPDKAAGQFAGQSSILNLFGRFGIAAPKAGAGFPVPKSDADWVKLGILRGNPHSNIFQLAHRNFRSFHKWRQSELVASALAEAKAALPGHGATPKTVAAKVAAAVPESAKGTRVTQVDAVPPPGR